MVERPGRCPAQCSAQRDRGAIGAAAAAAADLNPAPKIVPPHLCYNRTTIMEARNRHGGGSNRRARPEWYFARVEVARIRLAVLEGCAVPYALDRRLTTESWSDRASLPRKRARTAHGNGY